MRPTPDPQLSLLKLLHVAGGGTLVLFGGAFLLLGLRGPALVEASYAAFTLGTLAWLQLTGRGYQAVVWLHGFGVILVPLGVTLCLGGLPASGGFMVWGLIGPLAAMMFLGRRATLITGASYLAALFLSAAVPAEALGAWATLPPAWLLPVLAVSNAAGASILVLATLSHFVRRLREEQERAYALLLNILPPEIAAVLKARHTTIAQHHAGASILFADIVDFTPLCDRLTPAEIVDLLNAVFSHFDELAARYGMEKIKTIGDAYMVVAGVPEPDPRHACKAAGLALDMRAAVASRLFAGHHIDLRVGINSGPVMAGVIGRRKFIYDVWGQAVNLASRMESQGVPGCIQISRSTYELIRGEFTCRANGARPMKGYGPVEVWTLLERTEEPAAESAAAAAPA